MHHNHKDRQSSGYNGGSPRNNYRCLCELYYMFELRIQEANCIFSAKIVNLPDILAEEVLLVEIKNENQNYG